MEGWKCTMSSAKQILPRSVSTALQAQGGGGMENQKRETTQKNIPEIIPSSNY